MSTEQESLVRPGRVLPRRRRLRPAARIPLDESSRRGRPEAIGEVYVVGVDPDAQGGGLGKALTARRAGAPAGGGTTQRDALCRVRQRAGTGGVQQARLRCRGTRTSSTAADPALRCAASRTLIGRVTATVAIPPLWSSCRHIVCPVHSPFIYSRSYVNPGCLRSGTRAAGPVALEVKSPDGGNSSEHEAARRRAGHHGGAALLLTACGSDNNTNTATAGSSNTSSTSAAPKVDCSGKKTLKARAPPRRRTRWTCSSQAYNDACDGSDVNYTANGSGAGVRLQRQARSTSAARTPPWTRRRASRTRPPAPLRQPGLEPPARVRPDHPRLQREGRGRPRCWTPPTASKIFDGEIKNWNDDGDQDAQRRARRCPAPPSAWSPASDQSGTTDNFQKYLDQRQGGWTKGAGKNFNGGVGNGAQGTRPWPPRSARPTAASPTSSGPSRRQRAEHRPDRQRLRRAVEPDHGNAAKSAGHRGAKFKDGGNDLALDLNCIYASNTAGAYPLLLATYEIVCSKYANPDTAQGRQGVPEAAVTDGQAAVRQGLRAAPDSLQSKVLTAINAIC